MAEEKSSRCEDLFEAAKNAALDHLEHHLRDGLRPIDGLREILEAVDAVHLISRALEDMKKLEGGSGG